MRVGVEVIVRADDRRVASGVAAAQPAFFEHGDIGEAMLLGEVVRGREAMAATADDDRVVARLGRRATPGERPVLVIAQRITSEGEKRIAHGDGWLEWSRAEESVTGRRASFPGPVGLNVPP